VHVVRPADDVPADEVAVVAGQLAGAAREPADDPLPHPGANRSIWSMIASLASPG